MENQDNRSITVKATVDAPVEKVWWLWTSPEHIMKWNNASPDWHTPRAENDLRVGGTFLSRMEARDGSMGFDFGGTYTVVEPLKRIGYLLGDHRKVNVTFEDEGGKTLVTETFDMENQHSEELQRTGWQSILDNFSKYAEGYKK